MSGGNEVECISSDAGGVPSWSWASLDVVTRSIFRRRESIWRNHSYGLVPQLKLIGYSLDWSGDPLTSAILKAQLDIRARLAFATVAYDDSDYTEFPKYTLRWPYNDRRRVFMWPDLESHDRDDISVGASRGACKKL